MNIEEHIIDGIKKAVSKWAKENSIELKEKIEPTLDLPKHKTHGDYSCNIAFGLAKKIGKKSRDVAGEIVKYLSLPPGLCQNIEIAGPGFINFYIANKVVFQQLKDILDKGMNYGKHPEKKDKSVLLEFVSANPTGPLTIAHARQAVVGDVLGNIFSSAGYKVEKEYYLNDRGSQMNMLGLSTRARYLELLGKSAEIPTDGYKGEYIRDIARSVIGEVGDKYQDVSVEKCIDYFREYTKNKIMDMIKKDLKDFNVKFNNWISEREFVDKGAVEEILEKLKEKGYVYSKDGAVWFASSKFGDDKDRVLIKSSGDMTYLAPDIAYHNYKYERDFQTLIDIWGPDHHGYIPRIKAAAQALDHSQDSLKVLIVQLTTLYRNGEQLQMSTRAGEFVSLRDLIDEVGTDAARYFLVMRKPESHLDFDLEIAKKETADNPVYYIQYAYARISSIFRKYGTDSVKEIKWDDAKLDLLKEEEEINIIKYLVQFPVIIDDCTRIYSPHLLTDYLEGLVSRFHTYYEKHRVLGSGESLAIARLALISAIKIILNSGLELLGVSILERM